MGAKSELEAFAFVPPEGAKELQVGMEAHVLTAASQVLGAQVREVSSHQVTPPSWLRDFGLTPSARSHLVRLSLRDALPVSLFTNLWQKIYDKRGAIERWFSSARRSRLLDKHQLLKMGKIRLHANVSMLAWLLTALARVKTDDYRRMRHMYIKLPKRPAPSAEPREMQECPECCLCPLHHGTAAQAGIQGMQANQALEHVHSFQLRPEGNHEVAKQPMFR